MPQQVYRIDVVHQPDRVEIAQLLDFLTRQFERTSGTHPADQFLTTEQFESVVSNEACLIIHCRNQDDELVGATIVTTDIGSVDWASTAFFAQKYQSENASEQDTPVFFITSLGVAKSSPPQVLNGMIDRLTDIVAEVDGVAVADFADQRRRHVLARHIAARVAIRYQSDWQTLGSQTYHAFRPGRRLQNISPSDARRLTNGADEAPGVLREQILD